MGLTTATMNLLLEEFATLGLYASLHTADPGSTGTSEISGGSPAYARQAITWNAAASANLDSSNAPVFNVPAATTVTHFGLWSASTGGTFRGGYALSASEAFTGQGTYTLNDADISLADA